MHRFLLMALVAALATTANAETIRVHDADGLPPDTLQRLEQLAARVCTQPVTSLAFVRDTKGHIVEAYVVYADEIVGDDQSYALQRVGDLERGTPKGNDAAAQDGEWFAHRPSIQTVARRFTIDGLQVIANQVDQVSYAETKQALTAAAAAHLDLSRLYCISTHTPDPGKEKTLLLEFYGRDGGPIYAATPTAHGYVITEDGWWIH